MKQKSYRRPITSHLPEVVTMFRRAEESGIGTEVIAAQTGYSRDAILTLRRPSSQGHGNNPSYQLLKDVAEALGYEFRLVPRTWRGQEGQCD